MKIIICTITVAILTFCGCTEDNLDVPPAISQVYPDNLSVGDTLSAHCVSHFDGFDDLTVYLIFSDGTAYALKTTGIKYKIPKAPDRIVGQFQANKWTDSLERNNPYISYTIVQAVVPQSLGGKTGNAHLGLYVKPYSRRYDYDSVRVFIRP